VKKKYRVFVQEVWIQAFDVKASSKSEARELVNTMAPESMAVEDEFEYSHRTDVKEWKVEEMP
jgi:hypothetical protein